MTDEEKPDPIEDVRKGLGLLFRAARTAIVKLPTRDLEDAVTTGVREVGRAIENVGRTIERDVFGGKGKGPEAGGPRVDAAEPKAEGTVPGVDADRAAEPKPPEPGS